MIKPKQCTIFQNHNDDMKHCIPMMIIRDNEQCEYRLGIHRIHCLLDKSQSWYRLKIPMRELWQAYYCKKHQLHFLKIWCRDPIWAKKKKKRFNIVDLKEECFPTSISNINYMVSKRNYFPMPPLSTELSFCQTFDELFFMLFYILFGF